MSDVVEDKQEEGKALSKRAHEVQQAEEDPRACNQEPCGQGL